VASSFACGAGNAAVSTLPIPTFKRQPNRCVLEPWMPLKKSPIKHQRRLQDDCHPAPPHLSDILLASIPA
jgi:hypothetical protein